MNEYAPPLMTADEYNSSIKKWYMARRQNAAANIRRNLSPGYVDNRKKSQSRLSRNNILSGSATRKKAQTLANSLQARDKKSAGEIESIAFKFLRHGVYFHYGVGRGYIRQGNTVIRGYRKAIKHQTTTAKGPILRRPVNWIDGEIGQHFDELADIAQKYHGDDAMRAVLLSANKLSIQKK